MTISAVLFDAGNILYTRPRRASIYTDFFASRGLQCHRQEKMDPLE
jgi:hypothetical protein